VDLGKDRVEVFTSPDAKEYVFAGGNQKADLIVDLSGSMEEQDFQLNGQWVDRLTATKAVANDFIGRRVGDRVGLILFGREAYLQTPLTFDRKTVKTLLDEAVIGLAGKETAIGDAIGLAIRTLDDAGVEQGRRVAILLTDGANTAGAVDPLKAAELAAQRNLVIYTVGIGADALTVRSLFGVRQINPSADLDEAALTAIADKTGGKYWRATPRNSFRSTRSSISSSPPSPTSKGSGRSPSCSTGRSAPRWRSRSARRSRRSPRPVGARRGSPRAANGALR
jgi:Ca-activated chloride channel family protein